MLYTHDNLNNNNNGGICPFWGERVYLLLTSLFGDTRTETYFIKTYTMLTPLVVSKVATHLCQSRSKLIWSHQIRKTQPLASTVEVNYRLYRNPQNLWPYLPGMTSPKHSIHSICTSNLISSLVLKCIFADTLNRLSLYSYLKYILRSNALIKFTIVFNR